MVVDVTVAVMLSGSNTSMNIWLIGALAVPVALVVIGIAVTLIASAVRSHREWPGIVEGRILRGPDPHLGYGPIKSPEGKRMAAEYFAKHPDAVTARANKPRRRQN